MKKEIKEGENLQTPDSDKEAKQKGDANNDIKEDNSKKEKDTSDYVVIESGLGIDE